MKNIERRRRIRRFVPIAILSGVVLVAAAALIIILATRKKPEKESASPSPSPTAEAALIAETPVPSPSAAPETQVPTDAPGPTDEPVHTEHIPIRISDENSVVIMNVYISTRYNADGSPRELISGSMAMEFVNNTDSPLYSASFKTVIAGDMTVTLNGAAARFYVSEDGLLTVPFVNELPAGEACELFIRFDGAFTREDMELLSFGYDTAFEITLEIESDTHIRLRGGSFENVKVGTHYIVRGERAVVHSVKLTYDY